MATIRIVFDTPGYVDLEIQPEDLNEQGEVKNIDRFYDEALGYVYLSVGRVE